MNLNIEKWNIRRLAVEAEIKRLKGIRDESGQINLTWKILTELGKLQGEAHGLYTIRAHELGHLHQVKEVSYRGTPGDLKGTVHKVVTARTMEDQAKEIEKLLAAGYGQYLCAASDPGPQPSPEMEQKSA